MADGDTYGWGIRIRVECWMGIGNLFPMPMTYLTPVIGESDAEQFVREAVRTDPAENRNPFDVAQAKISAQLD